MLVSSFVKAVDTTIVMRHISYADVFNIAKQENKPVMLFFHFDGCGACVEMQKTVFADPQVAAFYNQHFVCMEVNTRKGEGIETNKIYKVQMHPTFMFLDSAGTILDKLVGVFTPNQFVQTGQNVLARRFTLNAFQQQYKKGNRDAAFLLSYCYKLNDAYELDSDMINQYLKTQSMEDFGKEENIRFIYEFSLLHYHNTIMYNSPAFNYMVSHKDKFNALFDPKQVDSRILWILSTAAYDATTDDATFNKILGMLKDYDNGNAHEFREMDGRLTGMQTNKHIVLTAKLYRYELKGDRTMYEEALKELTARMWNQQEELNNMAWGWYESKSNAADIAQAIEWSKRSIELNNNYANNDTYAALLYKAGRNKEALAQADKAIAIAKEKSQDYRSTTELLQKMKEGEQGGKK